MTGIKWYIIWISVLDIVGNEGVLIMWAMKRGKYTVTYKWIVRSHHTLGLQPCLGDFHAEMILTKKCLFLLNGK